MRCKRFSKYDVYEDGRVYSYKTNKFLKHDISKKGYAHVVLDNKKWKVHRLVAYLFIPNPNYENLMINHKDGNKLNNHVSNLEWCTAYENNKHARDTGLNNVSKSNHDRWNDIDFRHKTSQNISKGLKYHKSNVGEKNPKFRYRIFDKYGKQWLISDVANHFNLTWATAHYIIRNLLQDKPITRHDDILEELYSYQFKIEDTKNVNRLSKG
jgi:homing nuclease of hnh family with numod4 and ienr domains